MKNIQVINFKVIILMILFLLSVIGTKADTTTLKVAFGGGLQRAQSVDIPSNVVAQVVYANLNNAAIVVSYPQTTLTSYFTTVGNPQITLVGPATITLTNLQNAALSFCTIQTSPASALNFSPSTSVVIPNDGAGPVNIILESSTDLINWTPAEPGIYGTTSSNRFFRVRAQR